MHRERETEMETEGDNRASVSNITVAKNANNI